MKIKVSECENMLIQINELSTKRLPVKLGLAIARNKKALTTECEVFAEQKKKIFEQYCIKDDSGKPVPDESGHYTFADDVQAKVYTDIAELVNTDVEINIISVNYDDIEKCDNGDYDTLTVANLEVLDFMIAE